MGKSGAAFSQGSGSQQGSSRDLATSSRKKNKDYLASFSRKMGTKLKDRMNAEKLAVGEKPPVKR